MWDLHCDQPQQLNEFEIFELKTINCKLQVVVLELKKLQNLILMLQ
jgi:hypothetical protein